MLASQLFSLHQMIEAAFRTAHSSRKVGAPDRTYFFELGFFLGALGRSHVCALYVEGVEIPSDYSGVLFLSLDDGGAWRMALLRELIAAGLEVDANHAFT